ncbi:SH3 domain-containing protein [Aquicoccus porphyridii]|uniref:SH3 domain-containing protein n=1 Tax=Aquicoccus porphyridii TaxID=1852029 RepID=A0A5A9ZGC7_9RHOB|nr:SH3 domain-containing protein [Aquicoccus porphyridii]KAA0916200.1 SH3 domain-containing protein [Aquicoccus porphyridii]RAI53667.1 hypothetical protein DOO74_12775 [Rhodobacteraceae bacterium AsT-22]
MWRFIVVTFGFLGWAFYELSGGADYAPRDGSFQAAQTEIRAQTEKQARRAEIARDAAGIVHIPPTAVRASAATGREDAQVVLTATAQPGATPGNKRQRLTLSNQPDSTGRGVSLPALNGEKRDALTGSGAVPGIPSNLSPEEQAALAIAIVTGQTGAGATEPAREQVEPVASRPDTTARNIRMVNAARANLRGGPGTHFGIMDSLARDTRVEVLNDPGLGWVELRVSDSGMIGWMATRLLVAID